MKTISDSRYEVIADREVLQPASFNQGPRIGRTQTIKDTVTGLLITVNFWYDASGNLVYIS